MSEKSEIKPILTLEPIKPKVKDQEKKDSFDKVIEQGEKDYKAHTENLFKLMEYLTSDRSEMNRDDVIDYNDYSPLFVSGILVKNNIFLLIEYFESNIIHNKFIVYYNELYYLIDTTDNIKIIRGELTLDDLLGVLTELNDYGHHILEVWTMKKFTTLFSKEFDYLFHQKFSICGKRMFNQKQEYLVPLTKNEVKQQIKKAIEEEKTLFGEVIKLYSFELNFIQPSTELYCLVEEEWKGLELSSSYNTRKKYVKKADNTNTAIIVGGKEYEYFYVFAKYVTMKDCEVQCDLKKEEEEEEILDEKIIKVSEETVEKDEEIFEVELVDKLESLLSKINWLDEEELKPILGGLISLYIAKFLKY